MPPIDRRTLARTAAWSVPAITLATAAPAYAASNQDIGAYTLTGTCGVLGVQGPGVILTASPAAAVPVGTTILINVTGVSNAGVFTLTPNIGTVTVLSPTSRQITLTSALPAGATLAARTTLSISVAFTLNATTTLPSGYTGTGAKPSGSVNSTLVLCSAS